MTLSNLTRNASGVALLLAFACSAESEPTDNMAIGAGSGSSSASGSVSTPAPTTPPATTTTPPAATPTPSIPATVPPANTPTGTVSTPVTSPVVTMPAVTSTPAASSTPAPSATETTPPAASTDEGETGEDDTSGDDETGAGGSGGEMTSEDAGAAGSPTEPEVPDDGMCVKGTTAGNEVLFIGESFIAASSIPEDTSALAIENGSLEQGDSYLDYSVSGTRLGDGAIPSQYEQAAASNPIRFVLMNGGGNDCLQANDPNSPIPAAEALYEQMAADGVEKVVYFFYPDAGGSFAGGSLQSCLNEYRPKIKALCDGLTAPKCYWLDLAETDWSGNETAYTSDGIHPNAEGSRVTAEEIWGVMEANCVAP